MYQEICCGRGLGLGGCGGGRGQGVGGGVGEVQGYCLEDLLKQLLLLNSCTTTTSSCWSTGLQDGAGVHQDHPAQRGLRHWGYLDGGVVTIVARLDKSIYYVGFSISRNLNLYKIRLL